MALKYWNGFEDGMIASGPGAWATDGFFIISHNKASGNYCACGPYSPHIYQYLLFIAQESFQEAYFQFRWQCDNVSYTDKLIAWCNDRTVLGGIIFNKDTFKFNVYTGNFSTLIGTSQNSYSPIANWILLELYIKIHDSDGQIILRVNGNQELSFSGDTKPDDNTAFNSVYFYNLIGSAGKIDDFILNDTTGSVNNSWTGGGRIVHLRPNADTTTKEWTLSSGSDAYALVDEEVPSDSDYLLAESADLTTILELQDKPSNCLVVNAVVPFAYAQRGSDNSPKNIILGVDIDGNQSLSSAKQPGLESSLIYHIIEQHPLGGNLSPSNVDAMKLVLRSAA